MITTSVIVPTHNRVSCLRRLVEAIRQQTFPRDTFELIIVNDGSTDSTKAYLDEVATICNFLFFHINQEKQGPGAARNAGIKQSKGEIIVFTDDDCVPAPDWLWRIERFFQKNKGVHGCGGRIERLRNSRISRWIDKRGIMHHPPRSDGSVAYLVTANAAYRRTTLEAVGGFRKEINWPGGEDPDLSYRVRANGGFLSYCHDCVVKHSHRDSYFGIYNMFFNHGRGSTFDNFQDGVRKIDSKMILNSYIENAVKYSMSHGLSIQDRWIEFSCGLVRAVAFSRGHKYQLERLAGKTG